MTELEAFKELLALGIPMKGLPDGGGGVFYSPTLASRWSYYTKRLERVTMAQAGQNTGISTPTDSAASTSVGMGGNA